jgi:hypothetical protein
VRLLNCAAQCHVGLSGGAQRVVIGQWEYHDVFWVVDRPMAEPGHHQVKFIALE